jgi:putative heme transporter
MIAPDHAAPDFTLPTLELRSLARRAIVPVLLGAVLAAFVIVGGHRIGAVSSVLHRALGVNAIWTAAGIAFEGISVAGYVALLAFVAGRASSRIGTRESAEIALAGTAATRLLPTAGAGGAALTVWSLRRSGLTAARATRTLLAFLVVLYSVFLLAIVLAGAPLAIGLVPNDGPVVVSAAPALAAALAIALALALALRARSGKAALIGGAVREAVGLVRSRDVRLAGAPAYWAFDAAVLWSMLHAFGHAPSVAVVVLAYFVGQVANTVPLPGSVSGGIAGVLIAFGVPAAVALPAVLAYRTIAVWLPVPLAVAALSRLRRTINRWSAEDGAASPAALSDDLRGGRVVTQTVEPRMGQPIVARPLGEADFSDELRGVSDTQRAKLDARAPRRRVAADHKLLPVLALDLEPIA